MSINHFANDTVKYTNDNDKKQIAKCPNIFSKQSSAVVTHCILNLTAFFPSLKPEPAEADSTVTFCS